MDLPLALSVHRYVTSVGAYVGLASIIAVALLVLLFFAQARETSALRDHVDELLDRISGLETRLARQAQIQAEAHASQAQAAQARQTAPALAAVGGGRAAAVALPPGAPAGVGAPALSAATRVVPLAVPAAAVAAARGSGEGDGGGVATAPPPAPVTPAATNGSSRAVPAGVPAPSRPTATPVRPAPPAPTRAPATPAGATTRRPAPRPSAPPRERVSGGGGSRVRIVLILAGLLVVAAIAVAVVLSANSKRSSTSNAAARQTTTRRASAATTQVSPRTVTVAVLNGTATAGLAHRTAQRLVTQGFQEGKITTAADQTRTSTTVAYIPGAKAQALAVAKALKLGSASVALVDQGTRAVACEGLPTCTASVFVTVGSDLAHQ